jgi:hypothetical protein
VYAQYDLLGGYGATTQVTLTIDGFSNTDSWTFPQAGEAPQHGSYGHIYVATQPDTCSITVSTPRGPINESINSN